MSDNQTTENVEEATVVSGSFGISMNDVDELSDMIRDLRRRIEQLEAALAASDPEASDAG